MKYKKILKGKFLDRPNRFIAHVEINGHVETVHVKNTGRCRELLIPGATVILDESGNPRRKTKYDLICVNKRGRWINMDSQAPNKAAREWLEQGGLFSEEVSVYAEKNMEIPILTYMLNRLSGGLLLRLKVLRWKTGISPAFLMHLR